jgi:hypothetical protein
MGTGSSGGAACAGAPSATHVKDMIKVCLYSGETSSIA